MDAAVTLAAATDVVEADPVPPASRGRSPGRSPPGRLGMFTLIADVGTENGRALMASSTQPGRGSGSARSRISLVELRGSRSPRITETPIWWIVVKRTGLGED